MAESSFVQPLVLKFDGHYDHWEKLMENFLRIKKYWSLVENEVPAAVEGPIHAQQKRIDGQTLKDLKARNYLFQGIDRQYLTRIPQKTYGTCSLTSYPEIV